MISDILEEDHGRIGSYLMSFLESVKSGNPEQSDFEKARNALHNHIYWEEAVLFPMVRNEQNAARINGLEVEHGGIWKLLDKIEGYIKDDNADLAIDRLEGLIRVLETHNTAEEESVYIDLEKQATEDQVRMILFEVEQATAPEGWVCRVVKKYRK